MPQSTSPAVPPATSVAAAASVSSPSGQLTTGNRILFFGIIVVVIKIISILWPILVLWAVYVFYGNRFGGRSLPGGAPTNAQRGSSVVIEPVEEEEVRSTARRSAAQRGQVHENLSSWLAIRMEHGVQAVVDATSTVADSTCRASARLFHSLQARANGASERQESAPTGVKVRGSSQRKTKHAIAASVARLSKTAHRKGSPSERGDQQTKAARSKSEAAATPLEHIVKPSVEAAPATTSKTPPRLCKETNPVETPTTSLDLVSDAAFDVDDMADEFVLVDGTNERDTSNSSAPSARAGGPSSQSLFDKRLEEMYPTLNVTRRRKPESSS